MKRYQIIKKDSDTGIDEGMDYNTVQEAITEAEKLLNDYESVFIYDKQLNSCLHAFNGLTDNIFSKDVNTSNVIYHWKNCQPNIDYFINNKLDKLFQEVQKEAGIISGGIAPEDLLQLENIKSELSGLLLLILDYQQEANNE